MRTNPNAEQEDPQRLAQARLPDMLHPSPKTEAAKTDAVVLILLFDSWRSRHILSYFRLAMWARHSWLTHTDAMDYGVDVKLYIDSTLEEQLRPYCEKNFIDWDTDVQLFKAEPTIQHGKKMYPYVDPELKKYQQVIVVDADCAVLKHVDAPKLPFFEKLSKANPRNIGYFHTTRTPATPEKIGAYLEKLRKRSIPEMTLENICMQLDVYSLLTLFTLDAIETMYNVYGWFFIYPAMHYHENKTEFVDWMQRAYKLLGSDEAASGLWSHKFEPPYSVTETLDIQKTNRIHFDENMNDIEQAYIHHGYMEMFNENPKKEAIWRHLMGVY